MVDASGSHAIRAAAADRSARIQSDLAGDSSGTSRGSCRRATLQRGARLKLHLDRADLDALLTLAPVTPASEVAVERQMEARRRVVTATVKWESLAPGDYRVLVVPREQGHFPAVRELLTVHLEPGDSSDRSVSLPELRPATPNLSLFVPARSPRLLAGLSVIGAPALARVDSAPYEAVGGSLVRIDTSVPVSELYMTTQDELIVANRVRQDTSRPAPTEVHSRADVGARLKSTTPTCHFRRSQRLLSAIATGTAKSFCP